jgi:hypothetical protein
MLRVIHKLLWVGLCLNLWAALGVMVAVRGAGDVRLVSPLGLLTCALLILAPALTFIPFATRLRAPLYDLEATIGWATLGFVVTFIEPGDPISRGQFLIFVLPLIVAIASLATLVAYLFGRRLSGGPAKPAHFLRARREGYLLAIVIVAMLLLNTFHVLTLINGALLLLVVILAETIFLARSRPGILAQAA